MAKILVLAGHKRDLNIMEVLATKYLETPIWLQSKTYPLNNVTLGAPCNVELCDI